MRVARRYTRLGVPRFDPSELAIHHAKHGAQFPGITATDYENLADRFLGRPPTASMLECRRKKGDMLRYDKTTEEFGVLSPAGIIRTYFKPVPCVSLPLPLRTNCHGHPTNVDYFREECKRER